MHKRDNFHSDIHVLCVVYMEYVQGSEYNPVCDACRENKLFHKNDESLQQKRFIFCLN